MRIMKKVISHDSGNFLVCCWDDCVKDGVENHKIIDRHHQAEPIAFVFCSERHKQFFLNSHREHGQLPVGMKGMLI